MNSKTSSTTHDNPSSNHRVAVVILNWNGLRYLQTFLPAVVKHSRNDAEVWIIDNGSEDESCKWVQNNFPDVRIHQNEKNYGFAKGYNEGLRHIAADYYVLLNSDVEVTSNWIPPVIDYMSLAGLAACQPKIRDYNRRAYFEHAGATGGFIDRHGYVFCAGRIFNSFEEDLGQFDENKEVFWASGAALFIRSKDYHLVGGFDEHFFAHMEEIDLCWRLKNQGAAIGACGKSTVYHVGGGTLDKVDPFKTFLNFRNNLYILVKNYHQSALLPLLVKRFVLDGIAGVRFLTEGKWSYFLAVLKAHFSFYVHAGRMLKKRKQLRSQPSFNPNRFGWYKGSILVDYFLRKKHSFHQLDQTRFLQSSRPQSSRPQS